MDEKISVRRRNGAPDSEYRDRGASLSGGQHHAVARSLRVPGLRQVWGVRRIRAGRGGKAQAVPLPGAGIAMHRLLGGRMTRTASLPCRSPAACADNRLYSPLGHTVPVRKIAKGCEAFMTI